MVVLDFSIVNVALPAIQQDLGFTTQNLQWIVTAYSLTFGGFLLLGGRIGDLLGFANGAIVGYGKSTATGFAGPFTITASGAKGKWVANVFGF